MTGVTVGLPGRRSGAATVTVTAGSRAGANILNFEEPTVTSRSHPQEPNSDFHQPPSYNILRPRWDHPGEPTFSRHSNIVFEVLWLVSYCRPRLLAYLSCCCFVYVKHTNQQLHGVHNNSSDSECKNVEFLFFFEQVKLNYRGKGRATKLEIACLKISVSVGRGAQSHASAAGQGTGCTGT